VTGFDVPAQFLEVSPTVSRDVHGQPLAHHRREDQRTELPPDSGPLAAFAANDNERPSGSQCPPQPGHVAVAADATLCPPHQRAKAQAPSRPDVV
jgi:hypothetical protein